MSIMEAFIHLPGEEDRVKEGGREDGDVRRRRRNLARITLIGDLAQSVSRIAFLSIPAEESVPIFSDLRMYLTSPSSNEA
jgi:hypothetical protein